MHQILQNIHISGIIAPGDTYLFSAEKEPGWDPGPIDQMYVLTRDEDILPALEMELCMILGNCYEVRRFIRWSQILDDCYEFRFQCFDKEEKKETGYSLFLHRLSSFREKLAWAQTLLIDSN